MFSFCKRDDESKGSRTVDVGYIINADKAGFIWEAPRKVTRPSGKTTHAKGLSFCPGVVDHDARLFEVPCPIDINIGFKFKDDQPVLVNLAGDESSIRNKHLNQMCVIVNRKEWRDPNRPLIQFMTPYIFLADEPVWISQIPPYYHYATPPWPGVLIGGRFPIHIWPRGLVWAFEWCDISKPIVISRGDPWFYASFETMDPSRRVRMIEAEMTPQFQEYYNGLSGVTNYVSRTFSLFKTAAERRPKQLLVPKKRD